MFDTTTHLALDPAQARKAAQALGAAQLGLAVAPTRQKWRSGSRSTATRA